MKPTAPEFFRARSVTATLDVDGVATRVLDGLSLDVSAGEIVDVVGRSGSGKSTLLRALALLLPGASAALGFADGATPQTLGAPAWRQLVSLVPQKPVVVSGSVRENLLVPWRFHVRRSAADQPGSPELEAEMSAVGLEDVSLDRDAARLSVGQQARLALARTLLTGPRVLLLDETDAALDDECSAVVGERVARFAQSAAPDGSGRAVVRVRHRADDGRATRRLRLAEGVLAQVTS